MKDSQIKIGIIGLGRMGRFYLDEMKKSEKWTIAYNKSSKHMKALTTQSLLHLSVYSAAYKPPAYLLSGVTSTLRISFVRISLQMSSMNASKDCAPSSPLKRLRTDTTPSSSSFCPTTSIYGVF